MTGQEPGVSLRPRVGEVAALRFHKYDGTPHWSYDDLVLGADRYGVWVGGWPGDVCSRPGMSVTPKVHWVTLVPMYGDWVATFNGSGDERFAPTYVDITDRLLWSREEGVLTLRAADLDLDVIRPLTGEAYIADREDLEVNRVAMSYPSELVDYAVATAEVIVAALHQGAEPFDQVAAGWLARCSATTRSAWAAEALPIDH